MEEILIVSASSETYLYLQENFSSIVEQKINIR
jgi:hypothetical protein